jgi:predicted  nucleic acid-binding Zn-ribbon protein
MTEGRWEAVARLERAVAEASARLSALRRENEELRSRVAELEEERRRETEEISSHQGAWQTERQELAERVERLASGLEGLLAAVE